MEVGKAKKLGFLAALSVVVSSIVGIGIFLKNLSVIRSAANGADAAGFSGTFSFWSVIIAWVLGAVITFFAALSLAEISTSRSSKAGLSGWSEQLGGKHLGRFVRFNQATFYYGILIGALPFLAVEGLYRAIFIGVNHRDPSVNELHFGWIFLGGLIILIAFVALNLFASKASIGFQYLSLFIKIVPLVVVFIIGVANANRSNILDQNLANVQNGPLGKDLYDANFKTPSSKWVSVGGIFTALPAVFFAFDSYANVGNIADDVKKPHRTIPLVIVFGIIIASIIYIVISIGAGLTGFGDAAKILQTLIKGDAANVKQAREGLAIFMNILISLSAFGVVNALTLTTIKSNESLIEEGQIMGYRFFQKLNNKTQHSGTLLLMTFSVGVYFLIVGIVGTALNTDAFSDAITNLPSLFFFLIYAIVISLGFIDRFTKKQCHRVWGFWFAAPVSAIAIYAVFIYMFFVNNIVDVAKNPFANSGSGLFFDNNARPWKNWQNMVIFWVLLATFIFMPLINHLVIMKTGGYINLDTKYFNNSLKNTKSY